MDRPTFRKLMQDHFASICEINTRKGHDYAGDDDALLSFKSQGEALGLSPEKIWGVFAGKHWAAIMTFIREGDVASEPIEGRVHDLILYGFLLLGLIEEAKEAQAVIVAHQAELVAAVAEVNQSAPVVRSIDPAHPWRTTTPPSSATPDMDVSA